MRMKNVLRTSSSYQHRTLREFLREVKANADDLLLHNNVRWLSKGLVHPEGHRSFLGTAEATQFSLFLEDEKKMDIVAFQFDVTSYLNELNLKLQGGFDL